MLTVTKDQQTIVVLTHIAINYNLNLQEQITISFHNISQHVHVPVVISEAASFHMYDGNCVCLLVNEIGQGLFVHTDQNSEMVSL